MMNLIHEHGRFMDRDLAEKDERFKQIIPYVVMTCGGLVFNYARGAKSGETRLVHLRSIGIGGHVNSFMGREEAPLVAVTQSTDREVEEEVAIGVRHRGHMVGVINDDSTPVGRVHVGLLHHWLLDSPAVTSREAGKITDIQWSTVEDLLGGVLETWSRIVLQQRGLVDRPIGASTPSRTNSGCSSSRLSRIESSSCARRSGNATEGVRDAGDHSGPRGYSHNARDGVVESRGRLASVSREVKMGAKCIVKGCENHKGEGRFVGDLCGPCHGMLTTGEIGQGTSFVHVPRNKYDNVRFRVRRALEET